jgi:lipopolysaccharide cholinephosphotransferase
MKENIDLVSLRKIQLDILKEVDAFCKKEGLHYWLCGGTLLGAIRHKGYIPWDDDIDISMPRPDYDKFLSLWNKQNTHNKLRFFDGSASYPYMFAKACDTRTSLVQTQVNTPDFGVYIDVFPVDGITKGGWQISAYRVLNFFLCSKRRKLSTCSFSRKLVYLFPKMIMKVVPESFIMRKMDKVMRKHDYEKADYVAVICGNYYKNENLPKSCFDKIIEVEFEGEKFLSPIGYDQYLSQLYGDYMKMPPKEKQVTHHHFTAHWK